MATCRKCGKKGLFVKVNAEGLCDDCVQRELSELRSLLTPETKEYIDINEKIRAANEELKKANDNLATLKTESKNLAMEISRKKEQIIDIDDKLLLQEFGLYTPKYDFVNSDAYKERLDKIRKDQKLMIKNDRAATGSNSWTVNNSLAEGRKLVKDTQKLMLRAFNSECDEVINRVKYNNFDTAKKRITSCRDAITKLGRVMSISITPEYYNSKVEELTLAFEYQQKKQEEKEAQKEARARMREEAKLQKELDEARKKSEKEKNHYLNALSKLEAQIAKATEEQKADLLEKKAEIEANLEDIEKALKDIDYREANQRAGYVYVISNIGSFGENVYKIGMTRRLDPTERVDELGDASVPFNFDVHAMIFSEDAPALEAALHKAFENRKLNMVNPRREFFRVSLDEIKAVVKANYDKTVEFIEVADAEQYRISEKMRNA